VALNDFETRLQEQIRNLISVHLSEFDRAVNDLQQSLAQSIQQNFTQFTATATAGLQGLTQSNQINNLAREASQSMRQELALLQQQNQQLQQLQQQSTPANDRNTVAILKDAIIDIQSNKTQSDVLSALVGHAANFCPRVALFIVKSGNAVGWLARGFDTNNNNLRGFALPLQSDTILRGALSKQGTIQELPNIYPDNQILFRRFGSIPNHTLGIPLLVRGKAAAVLYADSGNSGPETLHIEALELLVNIAGLAVELISMRPRAGEAAAATPAPSPTPVVRTLGEHQNVMPPITAPPAMPAMPEIVAPIAAPTPPITAPTPILPAPPAFNPIPTPPATSSPFSPPSVPAFSPAPITSSAPPISLRKDESPSFSPPPPAFNPEPIANYAPNFAPSSVAPPLPEIKSEPTPPPAGFSEEEQRLHNEARRFARLLVSEIKLYNEQKVLDGRKNMNLYDRLKDEIDRSRQAYDKRVSALVAAKFDYFCDELINILAEGDVQKLGPEFPGPTIQNS
jgi:hypothetical protein